MAKTKIDIAGLTDSQVQDILDNSYLELGDTSKTITKSPLMSGDFTNQEEFVENFVGFLRDPENLQFVCEYILNIKLLPYQVAILWELWTKPFPMLIATRGGGKCLTGDTLCFDSGGALTLKEILGDNIPEHVKIPLNRNVYGEQEWDRAEYGWSNGKTETIKIATSYQYSLEGTKNHPIRVVRNGKIEWVHLENVKIGDSVVICRDVIDLPNNHPEINEDLAWWLGATVGDGMVSQINKILFTNIDTDLIEKWCRIGKEVYGKDNCEAGKYGYVFYGINKTKWINEHFQLHNKKAHGKNIPRIIRESGSKNIAAFIRGLFDTDGYVTEKSVGYSTVSEEMARQVHYLLLSYGIVAKFGDKYTKANGKEFKSFKVEIQDRKSLENYSKYIGFDCGRKRVRIDGLVARITKSNPNKDTFPQELVNPLIFALDSKRKALKLFFNRDTERYKISLLSKYRLEKYRMSTKTLRVVLDILKPLKQEPEYKELENLLDQDYLYDVVQKIESSEAVTYDLYVPKSHSFVSNGFVSHNSFLLSIYIILRGLLDQGIRIVVVGAALRQSLVLFNYITNIWDSAPVLQNICGGKNKPKRELHMCTWKCGTSEVKFLPLGNGETIRGQRAGVIIADEFSSIDPNVFENVVRGFAAVRSQGLMENVQITYKQEMMRELGLMGVEAAKADFRISTTTNLGCNQLVIAGSASYQFNHFYKYFSYYKVIIESGGDLNYIRQKYPDMSVMEDLRPEDYCIMRFPFDLLPPGMMDRAVLAQGRATMNPAIFDMEYGCIFHADSDGFYPASLINACTCPFVTSDGRVLDFSPKLISDFANTCVMGIDPASEKDNFTINILEYDGMYRRIVYQWSITRKKFQEFKHQKDDQGKPKIPDNINDYLTFCVKHIRSLLRRFNVQLIIMDAGGGGLSIKEGLQDRDKCTSTEKPIYDMEDELLQGQDGLYILKMINFQSDQWRKESHHGLKKDLSDKKVLFPKFDSLAVAENEYLDFDNLKYEDVESLYLEIEQLKYEMTIIKHDSTPTGGEKWDVPKLKNSNSEEVTKLMKKDRFTSLLLSNWGCRLIYANENNNSNMELIGSSIKPNSNLNPAATQIIYLHNNKKRLRPIIIDDDNYRVFRH